MQRRDQIALLERVDDWKRRQFEDRYFGFFKRAWQELEPETEFVGNWHIKYLCDYFQKIVENVAAKKPKTKDIIVNIPPRSLKSSIVSVMLCPWAWTRFPWLKFINSSYSSSLSIEHCVISRRLIESDWYQSHWGHVFQMTGDQNVKSYFVNSKKGHRLATSVGGSVTGKGGDIIIADDLIDPEQVESEAYRTRANDYWDRTLYTRLNDSSVGVRVIVMQRLHEDDLTGHVLRRHGNAIEKITIPAELDDETVSPVALKKAYRNGLFFPKRYTKSVLLNMRKALGSVAYAGQYGQRPSAREGNLFLRKWWRYYGYPPKKLDRQIQSWDMSFKKTEKSSYVVGQVWGSKGADRYLLYQVRKKMGITDSINAIIDMTERFPQAHKKYIEDKANGPAIIELCQSKIPGIIAFTPKGSKEERASAVAYQVEAGNVYLPMREMYPWVEDFIDECANFPNARYDDQVDSLSMALAKLGGEISTMERLRWWAE